MKKIIAIIGFLGIFISQSAVSFAGHFVTAPISRCEAQIATTLQLGSDNQQVYTLQRLLVASGFLNASPNGHYGYQTVRAVKDFQMNNGISATGIVGPSTRNAINERLCDTDLIDTSYQMEGYTSGVTYVNGTDPFVQVVNAPTSAPVVYATPQTARTPVIANLSSPSVVTGPVSGFSSSQIAASGIIYSPSIGYTYGIVPQSGSLTVASPLANSVYSEGDTVYLSWSTNNLEIAPYTISLESSITGQSKVVAILSGNSYSFTLTKELLDSVCSGTCNNSQFGSFKIVVSTPSTSIAGTTSTLRAAVAPVTINRPVSVGQVSVTASKTPVNSDEVFRLYVNVPIGTAWNRVATDTYSIRLKAVCPSVVTVSIAGTACGQEFAMPFTSTLSQQEIPVKMTNTSWYKQEVTFNLTVVNSLGQVVGVGSTNATVNPAPFGW